MPKVKIIYDKDGCIGAGSCVAVAPFYWEMGSDEKATLKGAKRNPETGKYEMELEVTPEQLTELKDSADSCPVQVIKIVEI